MSTWAVGDLQGCLDEFLELLDRIAFDPRRDVVWLVGDLVNRGPRSLEVLRYVRSLGPAARVVLGNHDLHLLAIYFGGHRAKRGDTFDELLAAPDCAALCDWLRQQPLLIADRELGYVMTHAGIPHIWTLNQAAAFAREAEAVLAGEAHATYLAALYGNSPDRFDEALEGVDRWRIIVNYFTRMRLIDGVGTLDFAYKGPVVDIPAGWDPWYVQRARHPLRERLLFGHWASLEGHTGYPDIVALDTGCVWGRTLTAMRLEDRHFQQVDARAPVSASGGVQD